MSSFPPEWFDLKNYNETRKFKRKQWRDVFEIRRNLYRDYLIYTADARSAGVDLCGYHSSDVVRLREELVWHSLHVCDGLSSIDDVWVGCGAVSGSLKALIDLDYVFLRRMVGGERLEDIVSDFPAEISDICNRTAYIDFSRTDAAIIADFKKWLAMKREQFGYQPSCEKPLSVSAVANLYSNCVLPYLDLRLNELFYGRNKRVYRWRKYSDILFPPGALPDGSNGEDKVRLITHKMAIKILESDVQLFDPC